MSRAAFPAFCPAGEAFFSSLADAVRHYSELGFDNFDADDGWRTMRNGAFEAYIRPANKARLGYHGTVIQLHGDGR